MSASAWNMDTWKPKFFSIWGGQAFSLFGSHLVQFALIWYLTQETGSATVLATATLAGFLPQVVLGPFVGTLVDRWNRRWTMMLADLSIALATLLLAALFASGLISVPWIYVLLFVRSLGGGFHYPAMAAATSLMVPKDQLTRVQGLNQMLQGGLGIIAAPLGALAVELLTTQAILMIDVGTALIAVFPLLLIPVPEPARKVNGNGDLEKTPFWTDFKAGFSYVMAWPGLLLLLLLAVLLNFLLTPTSALQPLLITEHYRGSALELGWMQSAFGGGMLAGGILLSLWGGFKKRIVTSMVGLLAMGVFFALLGLLPSGAFVWAVAAAFAAALMLPLINGPVQAILQASVAPEMQGRVFTLVGSMASAMAPLGLVLAGPLADAFGIRTWYVVAGIVVTLTGAVGFFIPALMQFEERTHTTVGGTHESAAPAVTPPREAVNES